MKTGVYAGSFDPPTRGHFNILTQALGVFDKVIILISTNPEKKYLFSEEERFNIWNGIVKDAYYEKFVTVKTLPKCVYTLDYVGNVLKTGFLIRGIRGAKDLEEETVIREANNQINHGHLTTYFIADQGVRYVSSTLVKGLVGYENWEELIRWMVPGATVLALKEKFK